jgi:hypothetical protein
VVHRERRDAQRSVRTRDLGVGKECLVATDAASHDRGWRGKRERRRFPRSITLLAIYVALGETARTHCRRQGGCRSRA